MIKVVYVGLKEVKSDNVAQTGLIWTRGQVHEIADDAKAAKLLEHPLIWKDASKAYEMLKEFTPVDPSPRINVIPDGMPTEGVYWDPFVIPVPAAVFDGVRNGSLQAVFMAPADADAYAAWKELDKETAPAKTGPTAQDKETRPGLESKTLHAKKSA